MSKRTFSKIGRDPATLPAPASKSTAFLPIVAETMRECAAGTGKCVYFAYEQDLMRQRALFSLYNNRLLQHVKEQVEIAAAKGKLSTVICEFHLPNRHALGVSKAGPVEIHSNDAKSHRGTLEAAHLAVWGLVSNATTARASFVAVLDTLLGPGGWVTFAQDEKQPDLHVSVHLHWVRAVLM